ncbi:MAG: hypothetical protein QG597_3515 [Actinomycetota bacterium]|jgi:hypothetical protein|nr:hypothetical protein [Actinomycetota bacterium]
MSETLMTAEKAAALRTPFPSSAISKLPKGGTTLDFVGHAAVTQRLLEVDPHWNWEPVAFGPDGLPATDDKGGLWIRLTVCGVTRLGYGEPQGGDAYDKVKGSIGNAIRNAAMRFGVALDLWSKDDISSTVEKPIPAASNEQILQIVALGKDLGKDEADLLEGVITIAKRPLDAVTDLNEVEAAAVVRVMKTAIARKAKEQAAADAAAAASPEVEAAVAAEGELASSAQILEVEDLVARLGEAAVERKFEGLTAIVGRPITAVSDLTSLEADTVIARLTAKVAAKDEREAQPKAA